MEQIVLRAFNPKRQQPVKVCPLEDKTGKVFTGQGPTGYYQAITPEEMKNMPYVVTPETYVTITDGKVLDMKDHVDEANWKWMQKHPYITMDKERRHNRDIVFYVENKQKEAKDRLTKDRRITKAKYFIENETNFTQRVELATAMGLPGADQLDSVMLEDWLVQQAEVTPDTVLEMLKPENALDNKLRGLFHQLKIQNIISKHKGGIFRMGGADGLVLGRNEDQVIKFMSDEKNNETVVALKAMLVEKTGEVVIDVK